MNRPCPYCHAESTQWIEAEAVFRCSDCGRSSLPESHSGAARSAAGARVPRPRRAPGEGNSLQAALYSVFATAACYGLLFLFPESALFELFAERGWVPYVITGISSWALCLLVAKARRLRAEKAVLSAKLLDLPPGALLTPDQARAAIDRIAAQPASVSESFLADRLVRALRYFEVRRRVVEVVEHLSAESRADDLRVDASYSLVRVFVWAIPTLGFIGTVIGIGGAVGGFSQALDAAASIEGMKESIGSVTGGLGVAFDTTLLALVMSILIMFPANAVQRIEEELLARVDDYCTQELVQRLKDDGPSRESDAFAAAVAEKLLSALGRSQLAETQGAAHPVSSSASPS